jgi:hypothetical protein
MFTVRLTASNVGVDRNSLDAHHLHGTATGADAKPQTPQQQEGDTLKVRKKSQRRGVVEAGTFVSRHGQQTLSNTVWALATFDVEELEGVQEAIAACCQLFCAMRPQDVYPQVCY